MKNNIKKRFVGLFLVWVLLMGIVPVSAAKTQTVDEVQSFVDGIVTYQEKSTGAGSIQSWINGSLTRKAGTSSEWYVIALSQYGNYDFSSYQKALLKYLDSNEISSASSRQKYALSLITCGSTDSYIYEVLNNSIGQQGVMSWIFGLHLLNNGYTSNEYSVSEVKKKLLSLQLKDGGWTVTGSNSDVDVTAMAIQALAPYYKNDSAVKSAVDQALTFLSGRQKENGDYACYGVSNPESTAQVLIALSALGIDCASDSRFIKNGNTLLDGIAQYWLSDGSFCHKLGSSSNETATVQVFYSMISYLRMKQGKSSLYILDHRNPSGLEIPEDTSYNNSTNAADTEETGNLETETPKISENKTGSSQKADKKEETSETKNTSEVKSSSEVDQSEEVPKEADQSEEEPDQVGLQEVTTETESDPISTEDFSENEQENIQEDIQECIEKQAMSQENVDNGIGYKFWLILAIIAVAGGGCIGFFIRKKRNVSNYVVIGGIAAVAILIVLFTNFQSTDDYYDQENTRSGSSIGTITITIRCDTIPDKREAHIPDNGILLDETEIEIEDGDTVYDALSEVTANNKIHLETTGSGDSLYVEGIGNIYEFDFGDLSGWMYFVNGESPSVSCGKYILSADDEIEWIYTCQLGDDIE